MLQSISSSFSLVTFDRTWEVRADALLDPWENKLTPMDEATDSCARHIHQKKARKQKVTSLLVTSSEHCS